jgi:lipopolysaccharide/colanic/teichoic acid biosynthesis glycosyltransferase
MVVKKYFDFFVSLTGIICLFPLLAAIYILIKIKMPDGPVLFKQKRVGQNGKLFTLYKFRTMRLNSSSDTISIKGDERITPVGNILRKIKFDELPELVNIINGDMSFVGPRPDVPGYADQLQGNDRKVLLLKPGITGPASLKYINEEKILANVRNPKEFNDDIIFPDKVRINLLYLENWTLWLDIKIILHTILRKKYVESDYFKNV